MEPIAGKILGVSEQASYFLDSLRVSLSPLFALDILIVTILFYWAYLFLKETRAMRILYGIIFVVLLFAIGNLLNLVLLNWMLKNLMTMLVVAIPVVFQPELRTVLERVGRSKFLGEMIFAHEDSSLAVSEVIEAVGRFSQKKIGALIILQRQTGLREYIDNGVSLKACVSAPLLTSIFLPRSPLHDGAVIIFGNKIISARSTLPVSDARLNPDLGMRHKAAVGITENSDAVAVIVSEESGSISLAVGGKLERRIAEERLRNRLAALMRFGK